MLHRPTEKRICHLCHRQLPHRLGDDSTTSKNVGTGNNLEQFCHTMYTEEECITKY